VLHRSAPLPVLKGALGSKANISMTAVPLLSAKVKSDGQPALEDEYLPDVEQIGGVIVDATDASFFQPFTDQ
jgi:hypothetical protein